MISNGMYSGWGSYHLLAYKLAAVLLFGIEKEAVINADSVGCEWMHKVAFPRVARFFILSSYYNLLPTLR